MTVNNKDVNIDFQKMSHLKMKKNDHKLNRFFDHKLDTQLYMKKKYKLYFQRTSKESCHLPLLIELISVLWFRPSLDHTHFTQRKMRLFFGSSRKELE